jgi:hypothetical protein
MDWNQIIKNQHVSETFMLEHIDDIDWGLVCREQKLTEGFISLLASENVELDWNAISVHQVISEQFINDHIDKLNLRHVIKFQTLSEEYLMFLKDYIARNYSSETETTDENEVSDTKNN